MKINNIHKAIRIFAIVNSDGIIQEEFISCDYEKLHEKLKQHQLAPEFRIVRIDGTFHGYLS